MANEIRRATHVITRPNKYASGMKRFPRPDAERRSAAAPLPESEQMVPGPEGWGHPIAESRKASRVPPTHGLEVGELGHGARPAGGDPREAGPAAALRPPVGPGAALGLRRPA